MESDSASGVLYNPYGASSDDQLIIRDQVRLLVESRQASPSREIILLIPDHALTTFMEETRAVKRITKVELCPSSTPGPLISATTGVPLKVDHAIHVYWMKAPLKGRCGQCPSCKNPKWHKACTGRTPETHSVTPEPHGSSTAHQQLVDEMEQYAHHVPSQSVSTPLRDLVINEGAPLSNIDVFMKQVLEECSRDPKAKAHIDRCTSQPAAAQKEGWQIIGRHLWRFSMGWFQLYIPDCLMLKQQVLLECHSSSPGGHRGWNSTYEKVARRCYWPHMQADVQSFVAECVTCQTTKVNRAKPYGLLHPVPVPFSRWEVVAMDFVNGLSDNNAGRFNSILTITCRYSRAVRLIPMRMGKKMSQAVQVAKLFRDHWWKHYGCPRVIISDRDTRFESKFWKEFGSLLNIQLAMTTAHNPQGNGGAERTNGSMEQILRALAADNPQDWPEHLSAAEYSMNDSVNSVTGVTPFELMYGENPKSHLDHSLRAALNTKAVDTRSRRFVETWASKLQEARVRTEAAQVKSKEQYDSHRQLPPFKVNDQVLLSASGFTAPHDQGMQYKMRSQWYGPFTILRTNLGSDNTPASYRLRLPSPWRIHDTFSAHKLIAWNPAVHWPCHISRQTVPPTELVGGKEEHVVERILRHRWVSHNGQNVKEWLVSWVGKSDAEDKWLRQDRLNRGGINSIWKQYEKHEGLGGPWKTVKAVGMREAIANYLETTLSYVLPSPMTAPVKARNKHRSPRILVLFSGTGSVEKAILSQFPQAEITTLDILPKWNATHVCSIEDFAGCAQPEGSWAPMHTYPPKYFDLVWASPVCTEYSKALTTRERDFELADGRVKAALKCMSYYDPTWWYIENPVGHLHLRPFMKKYEQYLHETTYCHYGTEYRKATHIWTNAAMRIPLKRCNVSDPCEHRAQSGRHPRVAQAGPSSNGTPGMGPGENVYAIPLDLSAELLWEPMENWSAQDAGTACLVSMVMDYELT